MLHKIPLLCIRFRASVDFAGKRLDDGMLFWMDTESIWSHKSLITNFANVGSCACMASIMLYKMTLRNECFITIFECAFEGSSADRSNDLNRTFFWFQLYFWVRLVKFDHRIRKITHVQTEVESCFWRI